jgi:hypothetical protein
MFYLTNESQEDWVLCRVFYRSRTVIARPATADVEAGSLSTNELISLPMPPVDAYLLAFDQAPAITIGGFYYQQDDADGGGLPAAQAKSLLMTSMVERDGGGVGKAELHQDWTEAAVYAQHGAMPSLSQTWNPFLNSG